MTPEQFDLLLEVFHSIDSTLLGCRWILFGISMFLLIIAWRPK